MNLADRKINSWRPYVAIYVGLGFFLLSAMVISAIHRRAHHTVQTRILNDSEKQAVITSLTRIEYEVPEVGLYTQSIKERIEQGPVFVSNESGNDLVVWQIEDSLWFSARFFKQKPMEKGKSLLKMIVSSGSKFKPIGKAD